MEAALWLFSTAVQGDSSAQKLGLAALPDLVRMLDNGELHRSQGANETFSVCPDFAEVMDRECL